jgi:hypothetical protein
MRYGGGEFGGGSILVTFQGFCNITARLDMAILREIHNNKTTTSHIYMKPVLGLENAIFGSLMPHDMACL